MLILLSGQSRSESWLVLVVLVVLVLTVSVSCCFCSAGLILRQETGSDLLSRTGMRPPLRTFSSSRLRPRMRATASLWVAAFTGSPLIFRSWSPGWRPCKHTFLL